MAGYIFDFFGFKADDRSMAASMYAYQKRCPFLGSQCTKVLSRDRTISGVCAVRQKTEGSPNVICCPIRMYADNYKMLKDISKLAFEKELNLYAGRVAVEKAKKEGGSIAVFGHGWGGELHLPQREGKGSYFCDWVLARLDDKGQLAEITAIEVQTIDTTGNYRDAREALLDDNREIVPDTVGLNWENVSKRIIPQLIYKGQVLQREEMCRAGLYFVCPLAVYNKVIGRLGGKEKLTKMPKQPASVHFVAYDYLNSTCKKGENLPIGLIETHDTAVYKIQEAFSSISLPEENVYEKAIIQSLYGMP